VALEDELRFLQILAAFLRAAAVLFGQTSGEKPVFYFMRHASRRVRHKPKK